MEELVFNFTYGNFENYSLKFDNKLNIVKIYHIDSNNASTWRSCIVGNEETTVQEIYDNIIKFIERKSQYWKINALDVVDMMKRNDRIKF